jgi:hypothetical protein
MASSAGSKPTFSTRLVRNELWKPTFLQLPNITITILSFSTTTIPTTKKSNHSISIANQQP